MKPTHRLKALPKVAVQKLGSGFMRLGMDYKQRATVYICDGDELTVRKTEEFDRLFDPIPTEPNGKTKASSGR